MSGPSPVTESAPAAKRGINRGCIIGVIAAVVLLCVCVALFGVLGGSYFLVSQLNTPAPLPLITSAPTGEARRTSTPSTRDTRTSTPATLRTRTNTPPATVARTNTPSVPTTPSGADVGSTWPIVISDAFASNTNGWVEGPASTENGTHNRTLGNGKYRWEAKSVKGNVRWVTPKSDSFSEMHVTVEAKRVSGPTNIGYGVAFRVDDDGNFYLFDIGDDRKFYVGLFHEDSWTDLIDWTPSNAIRPGAVNRLTVSADGAHFIFYINDQKVGEVNDATIYSGQAGLALDLQADQNVVVEFSKFELRAP